MEILKFQGDADYLLWKLECLLISVGRVIWPGASVILNGDAGSWKSLLPSQLGRLAVIRKVYEQQKTISKSTEN